jgi:oxygen-dependent protoporphyrinogen oxidase
VIAAGQSSAPQHDAIVVGGGMAGLTAALGLQEAGRRVLLLEAADYLGGRVRTIDYGQQYAEAGAMVVTTDEKPTFDLMERLSVHDLLELGTHGVELCLGSSLLCLGRIDGRVRNVRDLVDLGRLALASRRAGLPSGGLRLLRAYQRFLRVMDEEAGHISFPYKPDARPDWDALSFGEFLDRFHPALRDYADIQLRVTAGETTDRISFFWGLVTTAWNTEGSFYWVRGGSSTLPRAAVGRLGSSIRANSRVVEVCQDSTVRVRYERGATIEEATARCAIVATTPRVARGIVPDLPEWKRDALAAVPYATYIAVHLRSRTRFWDSAIRTGYLNCARVVFADLVNGTLGQPGDEGILIAFLSGPDATRLIAADDAEILAEVERDIERIFPGQWRHVIERRIYRWPDGIPYFPPRYAETLERLRRPVGRLVFCGDYTEGAGINDAVASGDRAAREVLAQLS